MAFIKLDVFIKGSVSIENTNLRCDREFNVEAEISAEWLFWIPLFLL